MRKRNKEILLTLSDREFNKLEKDRKAAGMTRQAYLLDLVRRLPPARCPKPDLPKYKAVFDEDGRQVNDLAHRFNETGGIDIAEYNSLIFNLRRHMTQLEKEIVHERRRIENEERTESEA